MVVTRHVDAPSPPHLVLGSNQVKVLPLVGAAQELTDGASGTRGGKLLAERPDDVDHVEDSNRRKHGGSATKHAGHTASECPSAARHDRQLDVHACIPQDEQVDKVNRVDHCTDHQVVEVIPNRNLHPVDGSPECHEDDGNTGHRPCSGEDLHARAGRNPDAGVVHDVADGHTTSVDADGQVKPQHELHTRAQIEEAQELARRLHLCLCVRGDARSAQRTLPGGRARVMDHSAGRVTKAKRNSEP
mmetsp:Transcript_106732/g.283941  ORF Transcript_106732/g.283941 Transcript_106732/m.283941 type:complete len:245 (-) Transcript_106732:8-742(-)